MKTKNYLLLSLLLVTAYSNTYAQVKKSIVIIKNPKRFEYDVRFDYTSKTIIESKNACDTIIIDNPILNVDLNVGVDIDSNFKERTFVVNKDSITIELNDSGIIVPATQYNEDLHYLITFIRTNFSRDSIMAVEDSILQARVSKVQKAFYLKYPKSENTLRSLIIEGYCERIAFSFIDSIAKYWDDNFLANYKDAKKLLLMRNRKFYSIGDKFNLNKFTSTTKSKGNKLLMISDPGCGFTELWLQRLEPQQHIFTQKYYFHVEKGGFNKSAKTSGFVDVYVEESTLDDDLLGFRASGTPYFVVLDNKNRIEFFGYGEKLRDKYFGKKEK
jgi:hypothetical protein